MARRVSKARTLPRGSSANSSHRESADPPTGAAADWWDIYPNPLSVTSLCWPTHCGYATTIAGMGTGANPTTIRLVTNLNASGSGSFRQVLIDHDAGSGPSTVLFEVAGIADFASSYELGRGDITILGDSAPSPGYFLKGDLLRIGASCDNVLIRHLGFMPGRFDVEGGTSPDTRDAFQIAGSVNDIVIMNCMFTLGTDGCLDHDATPAANERDRVDVLYPAIIFPLRGAGHSEGNHDRPNLIGRVHGRTTYLGALYINGQERHPIVGSGSNSTNAIITIANSALYNGTGNTDDKPSFAYDDSSRSIQRVNLVAYQVNPGPGSTPSGGYQIGWNGSLSTTQSFLYINDCEHGNLVVDNLSTFISSGGTARDAGNQGYQGGGSLSTVDETSVPWPSRLSWNARSNNTSIMSWACGPRPTDTTRHPYMKLAVSMYTSQSTVEAIPSSITNPDELIASTVTLRYGFDSGVTLATIDHSAHTGWPASPTAINPTDGWSEVYRYVMTYHTPSCESTSFWSSIVTTSTLTNF